MQSRPEESSQIWLLHRVRRLGMPPLHPETEEDETWRLTARSAEGEDGGMSAALMTISLSVRCARRAQAHATSRMSAPVVTAPA